MAKRAVSSLLQTCGRHKVEIIAAVDADPETHSAMLVRCPKVIYSPTYRGCSKAWNDAYGWAEGDPIVFAADDLIFKPGWLDASLAKLATFTDGWGLVGFNDGHWDGSRDLSTHYLMSRRFIDEVLGGVVAWEHYQHSFNDAEVNIRARNAGRYAWAEDARVFHEHWLFGDRPKDDTDTRTLGSHGESERIFKERELEGFPN